MLKLGVSYYPEHPDPSEWSRDLDLMRETGFSFLRLMDFGWSAVEPREGGYQFEWLDEFLDLAEDRGFQTILCTPTATPPAWLARRHPEIMIELRDGQRRPFGARRDVCVNSPVYQKYAAEIAAAMGRRYGTRKSVIGWQIDNELMGPEFAPPECHCPECTQQFREWLKAHYSSTDELNRAWGTIFWNQAYSEWEEIGTPRHFRSVLGQVLDYSRFFNQSQVNFLTVQRDALRSVIAAEQFVSHNSTAVFDRGFNHFDYARALDVTGWDAYRGAAGSPYPEVFSALAHDLFRSALRRPFWIFETNTDERMSPAFWADMAAHGACGILFFKWRRFRANAEQFCSALCDYDGKPHAERVELIRSFAQREEIKAALPERFAPHQVAVMFSADCVRAEHRSRPERPMPYLTSLVTLYRPFRNMGVGTDVVQPGEPLEGIRLLVMPSLRLLDADQAGIIRQFVHDGGILFACARTAHFDSHGVFYRRLGEPLLEVLGFRIMEEEEDLLRLTRVPASHTGDEALRTLLAARNREHENRIMANQPFPINMSGEVFHSNLTVERIEAGTASVLARFGQGPLEGHPAVLTHQFGKGRVFYMAGVSPELGQRIAKMALEAAGIDYLDHPHEDLAIVPDLMGRGDWYINHGNVSRIIGSIEIPAHDFRLGTGGRSSRSASRQSRAEAESATIH